MNSILRTLNALIGARMSKSGRFVQIETLGRTSGRWRATPVGYAPAEDGALLVRAGHADAHWARNLLANPACRASLRGQTRAYRAEQLLGAARDAALRAIKERHGRGIEDRAGAGPAFRLVPLEEHPAA
jgi:deazaflavin-dependent oxidoreductase (nitroreductase family)